MTRDLLKQAHDVLASIKSPMYVDEILRVGKVQGAIRDYLSQPAPEPLSLAYGHLWCINEEPGTPSPMYLAMDAAYAARNILRGLLTTEQRRDGINAARKATT